MISRRMVVGRLVVVALCAAALCQKALLAGSEEARGSPDFALTRAETLLSANDLDGGSAALAEAMRGPLAPEGEKRALALTKEIARQKSMKVETAIRRAEILLTESDPDGALSVLNDVFGGNISDSSRALELLRKIAAMKARKGALAMQRAELLAAQGDLNGASAALAEVFTANVGSDVKALELAKEIATRKAKQELSDEQKGLFETYMKRGQYVLANRAAAESSSLSSQPATRAAEMQKFSLGKEAEMLAIDEVLRAAEELLDARDYAGAQNRLRELTKAELTDAQRIKFGQLSQRTVPGVGDAWLCRVFDREFQIAAYRTLAVAAVLLAAWFILRLLRRFYVWIWWRLPGRFLIGAVEDDSGTAVGNLLAEAFAQKDALQSAHSAGLFSIRTRVIPQPRPRIVRGIASPEISLEVFDPLTANTASALSKLFTAFPRWFRAIVPTISVKALKCNDNTLVILTHRQGGSRVRSLEYIIPKGLSADQLFDLVDDLVFTMYYLIDHPSHRGVAQIAPTLRFAVDELKLYAQAKGQEHLEKALGILQKAQERAPRSFDAKLFEGITLDILDRHTEALARFGQLKRSPSNYDSLIFESNRESILLYNEAIANLRRYTSESLTEALQLIDKCITLAGKAAKRSRFGQRDVLLHYLARAARANIIAHKFIMWADYFPPNTPKAQAASQVNKWLDDIRGTVTELRKINLTGETDQAQRQLTWAVANAEGNAHLNYATYFLARPQLDPADLKIHDEFIETALRAFEECERTLTPLVETLSNLATVYFFKKDYPTSRTYCDRAIALLPAYEYSYYRKAQSYDAESKADEVRKVIAQSPRVSIKGFVKLAEKYK